MVVKLITRVKDLLGGLSSGDEPNKPRKELEIGKHPCLERITNEFERLLRERKPSFSCAKTYESFEAFVPDAYTATDIEMFSLALHRYEDQEAYHPAIAGTYLSALINHCNENDITIHTAHLKQQITMLGYRNNGKDVVVHGNLGEDVGSEMVSGSLVVHGSTRSVGLRMKDGKIVVHGDAVGRTGVGMEGGELHFFGEYHVTFSHLRGGDVYHKGKQVVKGGEPLWH